jgi:hypothetical protein
MANEPDYYMVTRENGKPPNPWEWEIRRHSKPMPVKMSGSGYRSQVAAELAGKRELEEFMKLLAEEEKRSWGSPKKA